MEKETEKKKIQKLFKGNERCQKWKKYTTKPNIKNK